ncbi:M48 family metallopeptidase [Mucilaginibacter sp. UR6-11]|uniref:tetratricopeptide repeat protein n=1 Tax=Mucilaginibacter sp. UR6-11 TaxID=1435644 RepID=UPI001E632ECE|nr:tetratricopeptide repeat protein [Mucilaginibacter sp. UR6-11]MCC8425933.1 tetratricopeptide repeat protein [Mucilaginibacter sp. UR6-11]
MKSFLLLPALLISFSSFAQQFNYTQWKEEAKTEINLIPEYGNVAKTKGQLAEDDTFIKLCLKEDGTYRKASEHMVQLGFKYLYQSDIKTAMRRFNQAWLLDHQNENVYWGFGAIYFSFNDYDEALKQLDKGLAINPNSSNILTDKATIYTGYFVIKHDKNDLNNAINLFTKSYKMDPVNQNTLFKLSVAYFYKQDCVNALKYYNECDKLGGQPIPPGYADALKKQCEK